MKQRKSIALLLAFILCFCTIIGAGLHVRAAETDLMSESEAFTDQAKSTVLKLTPEIMSYSSESWQIPNEVQQGIYFLSGSTLFFHSFETGQVEEVYTFDGYWIADVFVTAGKLYVLVSSGYIYGTGYTFTIEVYDLDAKASAGIITVNLPNEYTPNVIGADASGRIYLAAAADGVTTIFLLSSDGEVLSSAPAPSYIYDFGGFDSTNGNFYFVCYYNWIYWGYDHEMNALGAGKVSGNTISVCGDIIQTISQRYYSEQQRPVELLADQYLCVDTPVYATGNLISPASSGVFISDSHKNDVLTPSFSLVSVLLRDYGRYMWGNVSAGTRCAYHEDNDSIIMYVDDETLAEYKPETEALLGTYRTAYPVFSLGTYKDSVVAVEKDGDDFYLEIIEWKHTDQLEITNAPTVIKVGESVQLDVSANGTLDEKYVWESSDPKIISVTKSGKIFAWSEGSAILTVSTSNGVRASVTIMVTKDKESAAKLELQLKGQTSYNLSINNYSVYGRVINSYLYENADRSLTRVENVEGHVLVETYDSAGALRDSKTINKELSYLGGFFSGAEYNYMVFGQSNLQEDDSAEVLRIVKYSKDFKRLQSASVCGANTYIPFDAGSLRMAEADGKLYVYTCHEMYDEGDGLHHQANMTFVIKEADMTIEDSYYDVMNIGYGYVSHSFNQFIQADDSYVYRVDHGDAYPRGISLTRCKIGDAITNVAYTIPFEIEGMTGFNYTGVSVGGFELSSDTCLIAGNSIPQGEDYNENYDQRNIFLTVTDKDLNHTDTIWLTDYTEGSGITVNTPHLVKLGDDQFLLMWEEYNQSTGNTAAKMLALDGYGNLASDIVRTNMRLSDCHPIMCSDGYVRWYQSDGNRTVLYKIDPFALSDLVVFTYGDLNEDGNISAEDALLILKGAAKLILFSDHQLAVGDVDKSGVVDAADALLVLKKAAKLIEKFPVEE